MTIPVELKPYAAKLGFPKSETLGKIFAILFPDDESRKLVAALPGTEAELVRKTGISLERVQTLAHKLKLRGAIATRPNKPDYYRHFNAMIELRDASVIDAHAPNALFQLWDKLCREELPELIPVLKKSKIPPILRVVPIEKTVEPQNKILDIDSARGIVKDAELITATPCPCRTQARGAGRGNDCPAPQDVNLCIQVNMFAQVMLDRGLGERLTNAEALKRIGIAEDAGLVHQVRNNFKKDMLMCNCCACCCTGLYLHNNFDYEPYAKSRFSVTLDEMACSGCGTCEERCQFHAIEVMDIAQINTDRCWGCGNCVASCPEEALVLKEVRPREFIRVT